MASIKFSRLFSFGFAIAACLGTPIYGAVDSEQAIRDIWPDDIEQIALKIAKRESRLIPYVKGCSGRCIGLFQIVFPVHQHWLAKLGINNADQLLDPVVNAKAAYHLFSITGRNWSPWCHPSGFPVSCK